MAEDMKLDLNFFFAPMDDDRGAVVPFIKECTRRVYNLPLEISKEERDVRHDCVTQVLAILWRKACFKTTHRGAAIDIFKCLILCLLAKEKITCVDHIYFNKAFTDKTETGFQILKTWNACESKTGHYDAEIEVAGYKIKVEEIIEDVATLSLTELNLLGTYLRALARTGQVDELTKDLELAHVGDAAYELSMGIRKLTASYKGADVLGAFPMADQEENVYILTVEDFDKFVNEPIELHHLRPDAKKTKPWAQH